MPRTNRIDPWGDLHAVTARGLLTGNRGCLVDDGGKLVRHHQGTLWIICRTRFRGSRHSLNAPRTWTPVFFLDEAVGLAAGHRPCGFCRRREYLAYRHAVTVALGATSPVLAPEINRSLATQRHRSGRGLERARDRILSPMPLDSVPAGSIVAEPETGLAHLVTDRWLQPFSFDGWGTAIERPSGINVDVLTPTLSVGALANGFVPQLHPSAAGRGG